MTVVVVRCRGCGHRVEVELDKHTGIPTPPRITRVVEKLRKCPRCCRCYEDPRVVAVRWSAWSPGTGS
jgi:DNA replicative helicase MCM subunit Mcm2 (Cdc46/Mcm family)